MFIVFDISGTHSKECYLNITEVQIFVFNEFSYYYYFYHRYCFSIIYFLHILKRKLIIDL